jgi:hypothetical protein
MTRSTNGTALRAAALLLGALLAGCKSGEAGLDAGTRADAGRNDASTTDSSVLDSRSLDTGPDALTFPDEGIGPPPEAGPPPCYGPADCPADEVCCVALAERKSSTTCVKASACPTGLSEACGKSGNARCTTGHCRQYQCTAGSSVSTLYACSVPFAPGVTCVVVPDGGFLVPADN